MKWCSLSYSKARIRARAPSSTEQEYEHEKPKDDASLNSHMAVFKKRKREILWIVRPSLTLRVVMFPLPSAKLLKPQAVTLRVVKSITLQRVRKINKLLTSLATLIASLVKALDGFSNRVNQPIDFIDCIVQIETCSAGDWHPELRVQRHRAVMSNANGNTASV